jgi:hypothetical protein
MRFGCYEKHFICITTIEEGFRVGFRQKTNQ